MTAPRTIGNRIAPPKFIVFFVLLFAGIATGVTNFERSRAIMLAFDLAAAVFLAMCMPLFRYKASAMRQAARENDANRFILLLLTLLVVLVIMVAIASELVGANPPTITDKLLISLTLTMAWIGANTVYTLHYAHLYYLSDGDGRDLGGLDFPGGAAEPDYLDFVYFAFTIGAALQTSDVVVTSRAIRHVVILHTMESFIFNAGVLAMAIGVLTS